MLSHAADRRWSAGTLLLMVTIMSDASGCAFLDKVDKISKSPGVEEALEKEANKKRPGQLGEREPVLSRLQATPQEIDFGAVTVASASYQTVMIRNPSEFTVTVIGIAVTGKGFALSPQGFQRFDIPPHGQAGVTVGFQPLGRHRSSGLLLLETDSAGGRATKVSLKGAGI